MTTLLEEIVDGAVSSKVDLGDVLRKALILAHRLGHEEFKKWVERELYGYSLVDELPAYRIAHTSLKGTFIGGWGSGATNMPIPSSAVPEPFREDLSTARLRDPIATYVGMIKERAGRGLVIAVPPELCNQFQYIEGQTCVQANREVPESSVLSAIENVRNRLLGFVLEIQKANPDAGEAVGITPVPLERVTQVFNNQIFGNVGNLASGSTDVSQHAEINVSQNDLKSLADFLLAAGIAAGEVEELKNAVRDDAANSLEKPGPKVRLWLRRITQSVGYPIVADLISRAIAAYLGVGP